MSDGLFAAFEVGNKLGKEEFERLEGPLRVDLINAQFDLRTAAFNVLLLVVGDDREACEETIDLLHEWLDARYLETEVFLDGRDEGYPAAWRYWRALPARGRIGVFYGAWAFDAIAGRVLGDLDGPAFEREIRHAVELERTLADDGTLLLKFWLHSPKKALKKRIKRARRLEHGWRAAESDQRIHEHYDDVLELGERFIRGTDRSSSPWTIVESTDDEYRDLRVADTIRVALQARLAVPAPEPAPVVVPADALTGHERTLERVDLGARLERKEYSERLDHLQARLSDLSVEAREHGLASVLVFEGWDAAGKGGCIRRMTRAMAARDYRVVPIGAPSEEERAHHYLWRFWRRVPRAGRMTIFDRSWYGRVLVERVEGLATEAQWRRAYGEIMEFEGLLVESGILVRKFWLHIDPDEQLRRFRARENTGYKKYKLTEEDYRNREKWPQYCEAVEEMVQRTHAEEAPWMLVAANDKPHARITVLETVCEGLERALRAR